MSSRLRTTFRTAMTMSARVDRDGKSKVSSTYFSSVEGLSWSRMASVWFTASPSGASRRRCNGHGCRTHCAACPRNIASTPQDVTRGRVLVTEDNAQVGVMICLRANRWRKIFLVRLVFAERPVSGWKKTLLFSETERLPTGVRRVPQESRWVAAHSPGRRSFPAFSPDGKMGGRSGQRISRTDRAPTEQARRGVDERLFGTSSRPLGPRWFRPGLRGS